MEYMENRGEKKVTIYSDSLSVLQAMKGDKSRARPNLIMEVNKFCDKLSKNKTNLEFIWIPSHVGIEGNERADEVAKKSLNHEKEGKRIPFELMEGYNRIEKIIMKEWQKRWEEEVKGRQYYNIENKVGKGWNGKSGSRRVEKSITRMRLGKCSMNHYLHQLKRHKDGLCEVCGTPETIEHYLMVCGENKIWRKDAEKWCREKGKEWKMETIFRETEMEEKLKKHLEKQERNF